MKYFEVGHTFMMATAFLIALEKNEELSQNLHISGFCRSL